MKRNCGIVLTFAKLTKKKRTQGKREKISGKHTIRNCPWRSQLIQCFYTDHSTQGSWHQGLFGLLLVCMLSHSCIIIFSDFSWWVPGDHFTLLYHHGDADNCTNHPRHYYTAHVQFTDGTRDVASNQIKITMEYSGWKVGCYQVWNFSCSCHYWHCTFAL